MSTRQLTFRTLIMLLVLGVLGVAPVFAGSAVVGSVAGTLNASLGGQPLAANTVIFSGDNLVVRNGAAVIALENGNRMALGRETEASFLRGDQAVEVVLGRGEVSLYQADSRMGLAVEAANYRVTPATGYRTLGEVAMLNGLVTVTAKEGALRVDGAGRTVEVAAGQTLTLNTRAARAPMPQTGGTQSLSGNTDELLDAGGLAAGVVAAILAGIGISKADDATSAADSAASAANAANSTAAAAESAANAATSAAAGAAAAANDAGCALNNFNNNVFGFGTHPSPYTPPTGFTCP